ncbi:methyltransferase domain-containing protein [Chytriomyces sp. MP71]|nr:methyltransferase domain-containing protein [Chytriomyces sp. MP71]
MLNQAAFKSGNSKKQHEVAHLAALIDSIASREGIERIMDIGAGQGYLDMALAFQYGYTVIGVDDDDIQTCGARRRMDVVHNFVQWKSGDAEVAGQLLHVNRRVHASETFASLLQDVSNGQDNGAGRWLLTGLHSCGDLTPAIMKHFLESEAAALVVVGCCYNKLTEPLDFHGDDGVGFPLSNYLRSKRPIFHLGYSARSVACHATCRWTQPEERSKEAFKKQHFRALLQHILNKHGLFDRAQTNSKETQNNDIVIGQLKSNAFSNGFAHYAKLALAKLQIDADSEGLTPSVLNTYEDAFRKHEIEVAILWTLRSMMGNIFESLLLADRYLCLDEQLGDKDGTLIHLVPLFDPVISPRNMALVAVKPNKKT